MSFVENVKEFCRRTDTDVAQVRFNLRGQSSSIAMAKARLTEKIICLYMYPMYFGVTANNFIMSNMQAWERDTKTMSFCGFYYEPQDRLFVYEEETLANYVKMEEPDYPFYVAAMYVQMGQDLADAVYERIRSQLPDVPVPAPDENDDIYSLAGDIFFNSDGKELSKLGMKDVVDFFPDFSSTSNTERWLNCPGAWVREETDRLLSDLSIEGKLQSIVTNRVLASKQAQMAKETEGHLWNILSDISSAVKGCKSVIVTLDCPVYKGSFRYDTCGFHLRDRSCSTGWILDEDARVAIREKRYEFDVKEITMISYRKKPIYVAKKGAANG